LEEMRRCAALGISRVVSHIGAAMGQERAVAQQRAASAILEILEETPHEVDLCMEITAGQGSVLNSSLDELEQLVELCGGSARVRVCIDTCHAFAAGYELHTPQGTESFWAEFESRLGWERLAVLHLNDSKTPLGSRKDRHEHLGEGELGWEPFAWLIQSSRFLGVPMILETPEAREKHEHNLRTLLSWRSRQLPAGWSSE
jgi:deoxyribonuclease-4